MAFSSLVAWHWWLKVLKQMNQFNPYILKNRWCNHNYIFYGIYCINTLRLRQNGRHSPDDILKQIFLNENVCIPFNISLNFVPKGSINNIPELVQIMAWHQSGDKPSSEPMMDILMMHIGVTRPQWVKLPLWPEILLPLISLMWGPDHHILNSKQSSMEPELKWMVAARRSLVGQGYYTYKVGNTSSVSSIQVYGSPPSSPFPHIT